MRVLVTGGTGTVGSAVVRDLLGRGVDVYVLTRSADRIEAMPEGVTAIVGDLLEPGTVRTVFAGMDSLFLLNAVSPTEVHEGLMALNGARLADVGQITYLSIHNLEAAPHLPHFAPKIALEAALEASGVPHTILRANNFYQNDYWYRDVLTGFGVYPQPLGGVGLSRVDVRDIAEAAGLALTTRRCAGQTCNLVGPEVHTGESTAGVWSEALGKPVAYGGDDLDSWEQQALEFMPDWMVFDLRLMYAFFQAEGLRAGDGDIERLEALLGHPPRRFADFARETAEAWSKDG